MNSGGDVTVFPTFFMPLIKKLRRQKAQFNFPFSIKIPPQY
jgi:hypothetical protein